MSGWKISTIFPAASAAGSAGRGAVTAAPALAGLRTWMAEQGCSAVYAGRWPPCGQCGQLAAAALAGGVLEKSARVLLGGLQGSAERSAAAVRLPALRHGSASEMQLVRFGVCCCCIGGSSGPRSRREKTSDLIGASVHAIRRSKQRMWIYEEQTKLEDNSTLLPQTPGRPVQTAEASASASPCTRRRSNRMATHSRQQNVAFRQSGMPAGIAACWLRPFCWARRAGVCYRRSAMLRSRQS